MNRTGFVGGPVPREDVAHGTTEQNTPLNSVNAPSVWSSTMPTSIRRSGRRFDRSPRKLGCTVEALRRVRQAERDAGQRPGLTTDERHRLKQLERENFELKRANVAPD